MSRDDVAIPPELNASFNDGIASLPLAMTAGGQRIASFDYAQDKSLVIEEGKNKN